MHYEGKNHDKNVRSFFASWSGNTEKIIPQKVVPLEKRMKESQVNNDFIFKLALTSILLSLSLRVETFT